MATITGLQILERARIELNDPNGVRWKDHELSRWLNDAQREIAILRPDSSVSAGSIQLDPLNTKQALPQGGLRLFDITRNMGSDGNTPGAPIRVIEREELDLLRPTWHTDAAAEAVKHFTYDGRNPKSFYVYPRPATNLWVEAHFQTVPANVLINGVDGATSNSAISLDDIYATAIFDYVMMRSHYKDSDAKNEMEASNAYQRFLQRLGMKIQVDRAFDPNRNSPPREVKRVAGAEDVRPAF